MSCYFKKEGSKKLSPPKRTLTNLAYWMRWPRRKNEKNQKDFWKLLNRFSPTNTKFSNNISPDTLSNHFKTLLNSQSHSELPPDCKESGQLDYTITLDELMKASLILRPGKALGIDNISNEMISCLLEIYPKVILKLFNSILNHNDIIPDWLISIISPIYKKGLKVIHRITGEYPY